MKNDDIVYTVPFAAVRQSLHPELNSERPKVLSNFLVTKRIVDIFLSVVLIVLLAPLMFLLAAMVRIDGSRAIYGQERLGQHGRR
ncbi:MAG: hypothetical protein EOP20_10395, partial [Hyphomicrobiales bacterium]